MDPDKKQKLEIEGYNFDSELQCFVNRNAGKIYSSDWIEDKNLNTVTISLSLPHNPTTWKLYLNPEQPHEETKNSLYEKYGNKP
jgi:hypothetical protein